MVRAEQALLAVSRPLPELPWPRLSPRKSTMGRGRSESAHWWRWGVGGGLRGWEGGTAQSPHSGVAQRPDGVGRGWAGHGPREGSSQRLEGGWWCPHRRGRGCVGRSQRPNAVRGHGIRGGVWGGQRPDSGPPRSGKEIGWNTEAQPPPRALWRWRVWSPSRRGRSTSVGASERRFWFPQWGGTLGHWGSRETEKHRKAGLDVAGNRTSPRAHTPTHTHTLTPVLATEPSPWGGRRLQGPLGRS